MGRNPRLKPLSLSAVSGGQDDWGDAAAIAGGCSLKLGGIDRSVTAEWLLLKASLSKAERPDLRNLVASMLRCATGWWLWFGENPAHRAPV